MTYPPTAKQAHLLRYIAGYQEAHGYSPGIRQMRDCGWRSFSRITDALDHLEDDGYIRRLPARARAIEVLHKPSIPRAPDGAPLFVVRMP